MATKRFWTIADVGDGELACRDVRHGPWETNTKLTRRRPLFGTARSLQCGSCGSWKHQIVRYDGTIATENTYYELTEEYEFACSFTREECRNERLRRERLAIRRDRVRAANGPRLEVVS